MFVLGLWFGFGVKVSSEPFLALKLRVIAGFADKVNNKFLLFLGGRFNHEWTRIRENQSTTDYTDGSENDQIRITNNEEALPSITRKTPEAVDSHCFSGAADHPPMPYP